MNEKKPILAIDARPLVRGSGGIQRYLKQVLPVLINSDKHQIILYSDRPIDNLDFNNIKTRFIADNSLASILWHIYSVYWVRKDKVDVYWSPRHHLPFALPAQCKAVVTIHDFVWKTTAKTMPKLQFLSEACLMPAAIKRADTIVCISQTTNKQLSQYYPKHRAKSQVILHGQSDIKKGKMVAPSTDQQFFLSVGTLEPRKNYILQIKAFDAYAHNGGSNNLIIVGKKGWGYKDIYKQLDQCKHKDRISILDDANDKKLKSLYQTAAGFISISLDEGYGLPPQEAAFFGLPLLLAQIDAYKELYPLADLWVNPDDLNAVTQALHSLEKLPTKTITSTLSNKRDWSACAEELLKSFEK